MNKILLSSITIILALITSYCAFMKRSIGIPLKSETVSVTQEWPHVNRVGILLDNRTFNLSFKNGLLGRVPWDISTREQLENFLEEQDFQLSGEVDSRTAVKIGKLASVDAIFIGRLRTKTNKGKLGADYSATCNINLVDCRSGSTLYSGNWQDVGWHGLKSAIKNLGSFAAKHFKY